MAQQTAVEILEEKLKTYLSWSSFLEEDFEQAKAMEKEQLKDAYWNGTIDISKENVITKREQFAAMAMQGLLANSRLDKDWEYLAQDAVLSADILLWELNKEPKEYNPDLKP